LSQNASVFLLLSLPGANSASASVRVEGCNWTRSIPCLPRHGFCWFEIPGFAVVVRCRCRRDAGLHLARTNVSTEAFLVRVNVALHPAGDGRGGDEGLIWCCCEPSTGSMAEPLPAGGWLLVQLQGWGVGWPGHPVLLRETPGNGQWEPVG